MEYICARCKNPFDALTKRHYCLSCGALVAREKRALRKAQGLCDCGRPPREGYRTCSHCNEGKHYSPRAKETTAAYRARNAERLKEYQRTKKMELKKEIFAAYGGEKCSCSGCEVTIFEFLTVDHIEGGGTQHRKKVKNFYCWLKREGFPSGFRVLCVSCNFSLGMYGYCPHEKLKGQNKRGNQ